MTDYIPQPYPLWIGHADTTPGCHSVAVERIIAWQPADADDHATLYPVTVGSETGSPAAIVLTDIGGVFAYRGTAESAQEEAARLLAVARAQAERIEAADAEDWPEPARPEATR